MAAAGWGLGATGEDTAALALVASAGLAADDCARLPTGAKPTAANATATPRAAQTRLR